MAQKQKKKTKRITQKQLKVIHRRLRFIRIILVSVTVALVFFNFVLLISGGRDDVNHASLIFAPLIAMGALAAAMIDVFRYDGNHIQMITPLILISVSALFYLIVSISQVIVISNMT